METWRVPLLFLVLRKSKNLGIEDEDCDPFVSFQCRRLRLERILVSICETKMESSSIRLHPALANVWSPAVLLSV